MSVSPESASLFSRFDLERHGTQSASIADLLLNAAQRHPRSGIRLVSGDASYLSYPALLDQAYQILGGLQAYGLRPGAKIALLLELPGDFIPAFWASVLGGFVPCPLVEQGGIRQIRG